MEIASTLLVLSITILLVTPLSKILSLPIIVIEICFGIAINNSGFFNLHEEYVKTLAEIGILCLMFLCGMEVELQEFTRLKKSFISRILLYLALLYILSVVIVLGFSLPTIFIAIFPIMSLGVLMPLINDYGKEQDWLNTALKVGIIGEVVSISSLIVFEGLYKYGASMQLLINFLMLVTFLFGMFVTFKIANVFFWWFPKFKLMLLPESETSSQDIKFVMIIFIFLVSIVSFLNLELVLGAFVAGMVFSTYFHYKQELKAQLHMMGFAFFVPIFFIYIGLGIDLSKIFESSQILLNAVYIVGAMFVIRVLSALIAFFSVLPSVKHVLLFVFSNCMPLSFLVIAANIGRKFWTLSEDLYMSCIFAALIEAILFSTMIKILQVKNRNKNIKSPQ